MNYEEKKNLGKYYTINNPFILKPFRSWLSKIPNIKKEIILEPFAGSNNIVNLVGIRNKWVCFDILPTENLCPKFDIIQRDTIQDFPSGYKVCITNPPYLAKNSATRSGLEYLGEPYDDLYKKCLFLMLENVDYVAAIIPESFLNSGLFQDRLEIFISLTCNMFDDTNCPVCLALFSKKRSKDFKIYRMDRFLGNYSNLIWYNPTYSGKIKFNVNDPSGEVGLLGIDNTKEDSIEFILGNIINPDKIKVSSRSITRISMANGNIRNLESFIERCNDYLRWYRKYTNDIFLTPFKGLRKDGKYRRRLDFETAKAIMEIVLLTFKKDYL